MSPRGRRRRRGPARPRAVLAVAVAAFAVPAPAGAHPFGDPQAVAIALDRGHPDVVQVRWKVGGLDDLTLLGVALGLLPQDGVMLDGAVFYRDSDAAAVGPSKELAAYLLERITVASGGQACAGVVTPPGDLARAGASIAYTCPGPVGTVTVGVRTLTDLHSAYRTLATGPDGARAVYTSEQVSHDWALGDAPVAAAADPGRRSVAVMHTLSGVQAHPLDDLASRSRLTDMTGLLAGLEAERRDQLLDDLNYLNLQEIRALCDRFGIPYRIIAWTAVTQDTDRKPVILHRVRHFLTTGEVLDATRLPADIVRTGGPPALLRASDRLYYRWYNKTYEPVMRLLGELTGGRFRNGALARVLIMEFWSSGRAPTFREFAGAWVAATDEPRRLLSGEYAFLTDLQRGAAGPDWKLKRERRAGRFLSTIDGLTG